MKFLQTVLDDSINSIKEIPHTFGVELIEPVISEVRRINEESKKRREKSIEAERLPAE